MRGHGQLRRPARRRAADADALLRGPGRGDRRRALARHGPAGAARPQHGRAGRGALRGRSALAIPGCLAARGRRAGAVVPRARRGHERGQKLLLALLGQPGAESRRRQWPEARVDLARPGRGRGLRRRPAGARPRHAAPGALHRGRGCRSAATGAALDFAHAAAVGRRRPLRRARRQRGLCRRRAGRRRARRRPSRACTHEIFNEPEKREWSSPRSALAGRAFRQSGPFAPPPGAPR